MANVKTPKIIIRYENRKLYCPDESRYYNADEILRMVYAHENFIVQSHKDHKDVTLDVLRRAFGKRLPLDLKAISKLIRTAAGLDKDLRKCITKPPGRRQGNSII